MEEKLQETQQEQDDLVAQRNDRCGDPDDEDLDNESETERNFREKCFAAFDAELAERRDGDEEFAQLVEDAAAAAAVEADAEEELPEYGGGGLGLDDNWD